MRRILAAWFLASAVAVSVAACGDDSSEPQPYPSVSGGGGGGGCGQYTTCGSCTPVSGCGWCFNAAFGLCTTDPDSCANNPDISEFTWTWDPTGCPGVDTSVVPVDAAVPAHDAATTVLDAGSPDTSTPDSPSTDAPAAAADAPLDAAGDGG